MDLIIRPTIALLCIGLLIGCESSSLDHIDAAHPKTNNIILLIGDGMGEAHRLAARWALVGKKGKLAMDEMPVRGSLRTNSANDKITDSAAAATAMATGVTTNNGIIGMDAELRPVMTILEKAQERGMAVGLVTTTQIAHATPGAFAAHVSSRKAKPEIAQQMLSKGVDVMLGGGENDFLPTTENGCFPKAGKRTDSRNLTREAVADGYTYLCEPLVLQSFKAVASTKLLGLFADKGMTRPFSPTLAEMAQKAIDILSQDPDGFFLMIEGGQIDWASHDNDAAAVIASTIGFDRAVKAAKDFASANGDTLIIVTADHETGGMKVSSTPSGLPGEDGPFLTPDAKKFYVNWSTDEHTSSKVPVTAQGPGSTALMGKQDNTSVYRAMQDALQ